MGMVIINGHEVPALLSTGDFSQNYIYNNKA